MWLKGYACKAIRHRQPEFQQPKIQRRIHKLSLRSQGQVERYAQQERDGKFEVVHSQLQGNFNLADAGLNLYKCTTTFPGASINVAGN